MPWLEREYPELIGQYRRAYSGSNAPKSVAEPILQTVRNIKGAGSRMNQRRAFPTFPASEKSLPEQMKLDF